MTTPWHLPVSRAMTIECAPRARYTLAMTEKPQLNPLLKLAIDLGPLILFFVANSRPALFLPLIGPLLPTDIADGERAGIFVATAVFMAAIVVALAVSYVLTHRLPIMPVASAIIVVVFGALTLYLHDETFIKLKPTIIYVLFGGTLLGGHLLGKNLLAVVFDSMFHITAEGWRKLTLRWSTFFLALAVLNEIVWRTQTTDMWVNFKVFGVMPLTFIFAALQYPLLTKYAADTGVEQDSR
jgi:intracellular septation protein